MAIDLDFLKELDRFRLVIKNRLHAQYQGGRATQVLGEGLVFRDYSPYTPGDDIRRIDWKVFAKTEKLYIRRYEEERNAIIHIILDSSSSMNFGKKQTKFEYGAMVGLGFAYMALKNNQRFEFTTFSDKLNFVRAVYGARKIMAVLEQLNRTKVGGKSKLKESLEQYRKNIRSKALVVLISDFLYDLDEIRGALMPYKRSDVYLVQVLDPVEKELDLKGDVLLEDMEEATTVRAYVSNRLKQEYQKRLQSHQIALQDLANEYRARFIPAVTSEPIFDIFYQVLFSR